MQETCLLTSNLPRLSYSFDSDRSTSASEITVLLKILSFQHYFVSTVTTCSVLSKCFLLSVNFTNVLMPIFVLMYQCDMNRRDGVLERPLSVGRTGVHFLSRVIPKDF